MPINKDLLFFSRFCDHSMGVLSTLVKANLRDNFMLICIDDAKVKANLPNYVRVVPTIVTTKKQILTDENVLGYIQSKIKPVQEEDISPFSLLGSGTDQYSFLDDSTNLNVPSDSLQNFTLIGNDSHIMAAEQVDNSKTKLADTALDNYMSSRNADDEAIKRSIQSQNFDRIV